MTRLHDFILWLAPQFWLAICRAVALVLSHRDASTSDLPRVSLGKATTLYMERAALKS